MPFKSRRTRRSGRAGCHAVPAVVERLEGRELLAFSPIGFSLPDLVVSGFTAPVATWGGPFAVSIDVSNLGSSTLPFPQAPNPQSGVIPTTSPAASGPATVDIFFSRGFGPRFPRALVGTVDVPSLPGNGSVRLNIDLNQLPPQPPGFPAAGRVYVTFVIDAPNQLQSDTTNDAFTVRQPVQILPPLPDLYPVGLDLPPVMQPGDVVQPNIEVANFGTVDSALQGPVQVDLVAVGRRFFQVVDTYQIEFLHALAEVPQRGPQVLGDVNLDRPLNVELLRGRPVQLPLAPGRYTLTVLVDPGHRIRQLKDIGAGLRGLGPQVRPTRQVGPPIPGLPPAGVLAPPSSPFTNPFPFPSFPVLTSPLATPTTPTTTGTGGGSGGTTQAAVAQGLGFGLTTGAGGRQVGANFIAVAGARPSAIGGSIRL